MHILNKENLHKHCRTCLKVLCIGTSQSEEEEELFINMDSNPELQGWIEEYIDGLSSDSFDDYPQNVCIECYRKLRGFKKFILCARANAMKWSMLVDEEVDCLEVDSESEEHQEAALHSKYNDNFNKLLLNEKLVETESIVVNEAAAMERVNKLEPDPFSTAALKSDIDPRTNEVSDVGSSRREDSFEDPSKSESNSVNDSQDDLTANGTHRKFTRKASNDKITKQRTKQKAQEFQQPPLHNIKRVIKQTKATNKRKFRCAECGKTFGIKISLDAHMRKVHQGIKKPFHCEHCNKSYTCSSGLTEHIKITHDTDASTIVCSYPGCERVYTSFSGYHKHKKHKHLGKECEKNHVCDQCGLRFSQSGNLNSHRRNRHPTEEELSAPKKPKENFECEICYKVVHKRYALECHMLQNHSGDLKYECDQCGKKMAKKFMLMQHKRNHIPANMPCEHCGKQFKRKFDLEVHIRSVHTKLKPFECDICGMAFAKKNWLLSHKHIHDSEEKKIPCGECDKRFRFKYDLDKHVRQVHLRVKPYVCSYCGQAFGSGGILRHHVYIHTGEKPYECDICGKCFRQPTALKTHQKIHLKTAASN